MRAQVPIQRARRPAVGLAVLVASFVVLASCASKCPKVKAALNPVQITGEDVARINRLVEKRKAAIADAAAQGHDTFSLDKLRFSVTGYELAVETQLRIVKISPKFDNSPLYEEYRAVFDAMRCDFDTLIEEPDEHTISDTEGRAIQRWSQRIRAILRKEGELSQGELNDYLEEGIRNDRDEE
jgi:hypothetical protein